MAIKQTYDWAETELPKLVPQLVTAGVELGTLGASLGVTPAQITTWQEGAATLSWLQLAIGATRNFSTAFTNARDRLLLDKTPTHFVLPTLNLPPQTPLVTQALADPNFLTDYLDWCDKLVEDVIKKSDNYNASVEKQLGFLTPPAPLPSDHMRPTIKSAHDGPGGLVEFNVDRQNQAQIKVVVTLDDGTTVENRLPSAKIPVELPSDRPHAFTAVAVYCDKMGKEYGLKSQPFSGTSEV